MPRPLVAALLGTDHHPFDRLVGWATELAGDPDRDWFVQHGATVLPAGLPGTPMLTGSDLEDLLRRATTVITHGGPGLIMEARSFGHVPVVVPRDPRLGEHVDDHQLRFVAHIERSGLIHPARTPTELRAALRRAHRVPSRSASAAAAPTACDRFGTLVDQLLRRV